MSDLLPCPRCGGTTLVHYEGNRHIAEAVLCACGIDFTGTPEEWNRRVPQCASSAGERLLKAAREAAEIAKNSLALSQRQPIETAPKDGTRLILFTTTSGDESLTQYLRNVGDEGGPLEMVQIGYFNEIMEKWHLEFVGNPTHWMPLPHVPKKEEV